MRAEPEDHYFLLVSILPLVNVMLNVDDDDDDDDDDDVDDDINSKNSKNE